MGGSVMEQIRSFFYLGLGPILLDSKGILPIDNMPTNTMVLFTIILNPKILKPSSWPDQLMAIKDIYLPTMLPNM